MGVLFGAMETSEGAIFYVKAGFDEAMLKWMMERETGSINESMADGSLTSLKKLLRRTGVPNKSFKLRTQQDLLEFYVKIRNFL